jgi:exonuclease III
MKLLSWNCRGLGKPSAVRALKKLLKVTCPDVVFLVETKLSESDTKAKYILSCGPLTNVFMVNCNISNGNRSGGLALIWNNSVTINILNFNKMIIDMYITACNTNNQWFATGFYGSPYQHSKHLTCNTINNLAHHRNNNSWLIFGDFNLILYSSEKLGGNGIDNPNSALFNDTLRHCDLNDLGYSGYKYT